MLRAVQDVSLRCLCVVLLDQHLLHFILYILYRGDHVVRKGVRHLFGQFVERRAGHFFLLDGGVRLKNCVANLLGVKIHHNAIALLYLNRHSFHPFFPRRTASFRKHAVSYAPAA